MTRDPAEVARADRIVLPGQGAFAACMRGLLALPGMVETLEERVRGRGRAAARHLRRHADPGGARAGARRNAGPRLDTGRDRADGAGAGADGVPLPLPQMGWNTLEPSAAAAAARIRCWTAWDRARTPISSIPMRCGGGAAEEVAATTDYGGPVVAMVARGNVAGTQFHVEKSAEVGLRILANFLRWEP